MGTRIPHGTMAGAGGPRGPGDAAGPPPARPAGLFRPAVESIIGGFVPGSLPAALTWVPVRPAAGAG